MLDEGLEVLTGLWTGAPYEFSGDHFQLERVTFRPTPLQKPRIPIWVAAMWPARPPVRRAVRFDGVAPIFYSIADDEYSEPTPETVGELADYAHQHRSADGPFDIVVGGDPSRAEEFERSGLTWWKDGWAPQSGMDQEEWVSAVLEGLTRPDRRCRAVRHDLRLDLLVSRFLRK